MGLNLFLVLFSCMGSKKTRKMKEYFIDVYNEVRKDFPEITDELEISRIKFSKRNYLCRVTYTPDRDFEKVVVSKNLLCFDILSDVWAHEMAESIVIRSSPFLRYLNRYRTRGSLIERVIHYRTDRIATKRGYKSTKDIRRKFRELASHNIFGSEWPDVAYDIFLSDDI